MTSEAILIVAADGRCIEATIRKLTSDEIEQVMDRPALGAVLARPETRRRLAIRQWSAACARDEQLARQRAAAAVVAAHEALRIGQPLHHVADRLHAIAEQLQAPAA
jgi:hypothetical protein